MPQKVVGTEMELLEASDDGLEKRKKEAGRWVGDVLRLVYFFWCWRPVGPRSVWYQAMHHKCNRSYG